MRASIPHDEEMIALYREDPAFGRYMLDEALKEGDQAEIMLTMRRLADAMGGVGLVAEASAMGRDTVYRALSEKGNPVFSTLSTVLKAMGMRLSVQPLETNALAV